MDQLVQKPRDAHTLVAALRALLDELAVVDPDHEALETLGAALAGLVAVQTLAAAQEARLLAAFTARGGPRLDACVSTAGWLRHRTNLGVGEAQRRAKRARLLRRCPQLSKFFAQAEITAGHVDAVARRAVPQRTDDLVAHDATLADLARHADPHEVAIAAARIVELAAQADEPDTPSSCCSQEDLREVHLRRGFNGLGSLAGATTPVLSELLLRVGDLYSTPEPPGTQPEQRRSHAQRFHDALRDALTVAVDHHPGHAVGGVKTHLVLFADVQTLLGRDELATIRPRLSRYGIIDPELARHLAAHTDPTVRAVLGLGPWRVINVGRAARTLPEPLKTASQLVHQHCRGPGCDHPYAWTENDHAIEWGAEQGTTGLDNDAPFCRPHHRLKHEDGWTTRLDPHTGQVTWISPDHTRHITLPPPDP